jgi:hypothetical protein
MEQMCSCNRLNIGLCLYSRLNDLRNTKNQYLVRTKDPDPKNQSKNPVKPGSGIIQRENQFQYPRSKKDLKICTY